MTELFLVLDLDHTLLYSVDILNPKYPLLQRKPDFIFENRFHFYLRPHVVEFLKEMCKHYTLIVWSAATKSYVDHVITHLFIKNDIHVKYIFSKEHCAVEFINNELLYHKPLYFLYNTFNTTNFDTNTTHFVSSVSNFDITKCIIVDNNPYSYNMNTENGVPIKDFFGESYDNVLKYLKKYLKTLKNYGENIIKLNDIDWYQNELIAESIFSLEINFSDDDERIGEVR